MLFLVMEGERPLAAGARWSLVGVERITIGRGDARSATRSADGRTLEVRVPGRWISKDHAVVRAVASEWIAEDAGSRNGTFVNGDRITTRVLSEGAFLEAGRTFFTLRGAPAEGGPLLRDEDSTRSPAPFGLRTLLPELADSHAALGRIAKSGAVPILLLGPTGSGKEVLARQVHAQSGRNGPFVPVNCGALPQTLVEALLFGHVKGAFSGAARDEIGFVRSADGGTLFLDELGDMPLDTQSKLLRVLETRTFERVGANETVKSDFRLIAATNQDLKKLIEEKKFREELYFRLNVVPITLPPLRERVGDIPLLVERFMREASVQYKKPIEGISAGALRLLARQPWKGNIRELKNTIERMVILAPGARLEEDDVPPDYRSAEGEPSGMGVLAGHSLEEVEREHIRQTLEATGHNRKEAAERLKIGERTLYRKIELYGL